VRNRQIRPFGAPHYIWMGIPVSGQRWDVGRSKKGVRRQAQ
ncbi:hypothetical protein V3C99_014345, partial [Haemonchus contortus]